MNLSSLCRAAAAALALGATSAHAVLTFDDGGIHTVDTTINDFIYILDGPGSAPTTVIFDDPANITAYEVPFYDTVYADGHSIVTINGGSFAQDVAFYGNSQVTMNGGGIGHSLELLDEAVGSMHGGTVAETVYVEDESVFTLWDGAITDDLEVSGIGQITVFGGIVIEGLKTGGASHADIFGGSFGDDIEAHGFSSIDISGGALAANGLLDSGLGAFNYSSITLRGSEFFVNGGAATSGAIGLMDGTLSGTLLDGSTFSDIPFQRDIDGNINLVVSLVAVPEPSTYGLFGALALVGIIVARRRR